MDTSGSTLIFEIVVDQEQEEIEDKKVVRMPRGLRGTTRAGEGQKEPGKNPLSSVVEKIHRYNLEPTLKSVRDVISSLGEEEQAELLTKLGLEPPDELRAQDHKDPTTPVSQIWSCCYGSRCSMLKHKDKLPFLKVLVPLPEIFEDLIRSYGIFLTVPGTQLFVCLQHFKTNRGEKHISYYWFSDLERPWSPPIDCELVIPSEFRLRTDPDYQTPKSRSLDFAWSLFFGLDPPKYG